MDIIEIISKKKIGEKLSKEEIDFFVDSYVKGSVADYQASALCMAICINGMDDEEISNLTFAMRDSGDIIDLSKIEGVLADKHSTGGVSDTTSLVAMPLAAACGCKIAKMSGRGLGHTGGTLDKLESIPGYDISIGAEKFFEIVNKIGVSIIGQTGDLVPADKKLYALRDVTGTVNSIPLIVSSIMSKKLASGSDVIVLDVKTGSGAFMENIDDARELAQKMVAIGNSAGKKVQALVTDMNQPLGNAIGNSLEVIEAIEILSGKHRDSDLAIVSFEIASRMVFLSGLAKTIEEAKSMVEQALEKGKGLKKFEEFVEAHGGYKKVVKNFSVMGEAETIVPIIAKKEGYLYSVKAARVGKAAMLLGAGREKKEDDIDYSVGIWIEKRVGDFVKEGDVLANFYVNSREKLEEAKETFYSALEFRNEAPESGELIYNIY